MTEIGRRLVGAVIAWRQSDAENDKLRAENAALRAKDGADQSGWLIERDLGWYCVTHSAWTIGQAIDPSLWRENWTKDANRALRFSRREDAEALIRYFGLQKATATEHSWLPPKSSPSLSRHDQT